MNQYSIAGWFTAALSLLVAGVMWSASTPFINSPSMWALVVAVLAVIFTFLINKN